ncbi:MAG TPA: hypothetical protein VLF89_08980 [Candidatus Saccharimonadales bacterium]|nr:hypothetical protein [Candidatus Saccharimonadales bacterium]
MFILILGGLFCLSFLLSVFSLWRDLRKNIRTTHVTEELSKGRVIFHASSASNANIPLDNVISPHQGVETTQSQEEHVIQGHPISPLESIHADVTSNYPNEDPVISPEIHLGEVNETKKEEAQPADITTEKDQETQQS